ncbi:hypothetical protein BUALT_Bualt18G0091000 [Buddleja alternifolia]|uniref:Acid phosphatase/vanadium-dependent haloperoxidase-related protein n=1 Tax=Buddleja alternifolia TaxID=168488 RepID=A0AAV6W2J0_9LAMI|nr:hypothetical protein BUALT_Bualt18G0091000 [Buddleja alternifolia]
MLLQICNFSGTPILKTGINFTPQNAHLFLFKRNYSKAPNFRLRCVSELACNSISVDNIADVLHNKVIVAATLSAAIGQLSKPFTSVLLYGKKFDLRAAVQAGGFPSTHSSAAVATATSLVLERGFSDAIFGLAVVYASLIMYDAQGVRREVGTHAKELNKVLLRSASYSTSSSNDPYDLTNSFSRESSSSNKESVIEPLFMDEESSLQKKATNSSLLLKSEKSASIISNVNGGLKSGCSPLKESIGHTEMEVAAGALLGFLVSLAICPYV